MHANASLVDRYARAIFAYATESKAFDKVSLELGELSQAISSNSELERVLCSDLFSATERMEVLKDILKKAGVSDFSRRIMLMLGDVKRLNYLKSILNRAHELSLQSTGIIPVKIESGRKLAKPTMEKLELKMRDILGSKVEATYETIPGLIGGVKVTALGKTYDGSISGWLTVLNETLMGGLR